MSSLQFLLSDISKALPGGFDFYGLGRIEPARDADAIASMLDTLKNGARAVSFDLIDTRARAKLIVVFDEMLDESQYTEAGNVLASRLASGLRGSSEAPDWMISPPRAINTTLLETYLNRLPSAARTYVHHAERGALLLHCVIIPFDQEMSDV